MTMATSTVDRTIPWCLSLQLTTSSPSITLPAVNASQFDACSNKQQSFSSLTTLREIPTREFQSDSTDAVVDPLDDGDDDRNTTKPTTLSPTGSAGTAVPLPYQLELASIEADIARMKQCADNSFAPTNHQTTQPNDIQSALDELAAKIAMIPTHRPTVPLQADATNLPELNPMPVSTTANLSHDDDVGNHPLDARRQSSRLTETFQLQAKMLRSLNMMFCELIGIVNLIVAEIVPPNSTQSPFCTSPTTMFTICPATDFKLTDHFRNSQTPPWPPNLAASSHKLAPKPCPYKKTIPAKPPFNCGRQTCHLVKTRKDSLRPP